MKVKERDINSERDLRNTLDQMYKLAKVSNEPFYDLIELMCNTQTILTAIHNIKANRGSKTPGIDGKTIEDYLQRPPAELLREIRQAIKNYNPFPVRRKNILKENGKLRPLGISAVLDRIIQEITRIVIEPIAEAKFYQYSFGFRPMKSAEQAMAEILERVRRNHTYWVIEGDIKSYFDNINHNKLLEMLWTMGIKDKRVLAIIKKMLKSGVIEEDGRLNDTEVGSPQGGIISPLLANIYLNFFDWMIAKKYLDHPAKSMGYEKVPYRFVQKRHEPIFLVRYADDWVVLCQTEEKAKTALREIDKYFKHQLKLELSKEKTTITNIRKQNAKFLGFQFFAEKSRTSNKIVGKMIPNIQRANKKVTEICGAIRDIVRISNPRDQVLQIEKINSKIVGLSEYYAISNCSALFRAWNKRINYPQWKLFWIKSGKKYSKVKIKYMCKANETNNRTTRHHDHTNKLFAITVDHAKIGITLFSFTKSRMAMKLNIATTPYTATGRAIHEKRSGHKHPLLRNGTIYDEDDLFLYRASMEEKRKRIYNFEYVMNREYAYNRDKGLCNCCSEILIRGYTTCHHKNPSLLLNLVNKVTNLVSVCKECHMAIHGKAESYKLLDTKVARKIKRYQNLIKNAKCVG